MYFSISLAVFLLSISRVTSADSCVWLNTSANNSTVPATGYSPCDSSSAASSCCADADACLSNGYCTGSFGLYRGACTDWSAGVCPDTCPDLSFVSQGQIYYLANLYRCNGQGAGEIWWCGDQSGDTTAQPCQSGVGTTFSMTSIGTFVTPVSLVAAATVTSFQTNTITESLVESTSRTLSNVNPAFASASASASAAGAATSTAAPTVSNDPLTNNSSKLGIGLGVGLGLPLVAAIIALTFVIARRNFNASSVSSGLEKQQIFHHQPNEGSSKPRPEELYGRQVYEVSAIHQRAELSGREK